ncbi:MAG: hypothetical protein A2Y00_04720 [Omnitrophica WOR_2 bacterium GWF2_43_52]|nr:MAG: hypothetical protein A2Y01_03660 [Omnitrophica WOR_2 bacterium GWC2_44_8]OGX20411.1 MAG: hypothetical protein A2Y00_04720 [Omnitrophica WOR_2 bacterium GWF2_43_52]OGX57430.1 MAG: hypothetical protein A2460_04675 [Omnitrophica WOR_2 bacterium RIFOXYC2_FULL_43_9]HAH20681.1 hypothetical protein [Candidatus Omnitrophota bacterium]HBG62990.1 hypothetical protein [Candidatus Omnitrophota bacterium]
MKFIVTKELGRLAKWLKILGFDTEYHAENKEGSLSLRALQEDRIVLTRNSHWGAHSGIRTLYIKSDSVYAQIQQVLSELSFAADETQMFTRCILCNEALSVIEKEKVKDKVPEYVFKSQENFVNCPRCQKIYWQGSHRGNVKEIIAKLPNS